MINFNAATKTIEIKGREYTVGYARQRKDGGWSLGVEGKRGAIYSVDMRPDGSFTKMISV